MTMKKYGLLMAMTVFAVATMIQAECPNGCSGYGTCSAKDMCNCQKNFQGNDCSERTCPYGHSHVDTPKGDLNMDMSHLDTWALTNSQRHPAGNYETRPTSGQTDEGHYYMECSNRGLCDRETGDCGCFEPYEGSSCQRTVCPNNCNNHGSCESISEFATNAKGKLFHVGRALPVTTYGLWDAKKTYGCQCDPGFYGADCSLRRCKVGVDPMYEAIGTEVLETVMITLETTTASDTFTSGWTRLRFFDHWGEAYITERIVLSASPAANIAVALKALPNNVISEVVCEEAGALSALSAIRPTKVTADVLFSNTICQFTSNPGKLRLLEVAESEIVASAGTFTTYPVPSALYYLRVTPTSITGENTDLTGSTAGATVDTLALDATAMTTSSATAAVLGFAATASAPILIKLKDQYMVAVGNSDATHIEVGYKSNIALAAGSTEPLYYSSTAGALVLDGAGSSVTAIVTAFPIHSTTITLGSGVGVDPTVILVGDALFFENQFFTVTAVSTNGETITVDRPFFGLMDVGGTHAEVASGSLYVWSGGVPAANTFTYVSECSGRGLCDAEAAVCQCFKGYTSDNCDTQNILAF